MPQLDILILYFTSLEITFLFWLLYLYLVKNFLLYINITFNIRNYLKSIFIFNDSLFLNNFILLNFLKIKVYIYIYINKQLNNLLKNLKKNSLILLLIFFSKIIYKIYKIYINYFNKYYYNLFYLVNNI